MIADLFDEVVRKLLQDQNPLPKPDATSVSIRLSMEADGIYRRIADDKNPDPELVRQALTLQGLGTNIFSLQLCFMAPDGQTIYQEGIKKNPNYYVKTEEVKATALDAEGWNNDISRAVMFEKCAGDCGTLADHLLALEKTYGSASLPCRLVLIDSVGEDYLENVAVKEILDKTSLRRDQITIMPNDITLRSTWGRMASLRTNLPPTGKPPVIVCRGCTENDFPESDMRNQISFASEFFPGAIIRTTYDLTTDPVQLLRCYDISDMHSLVRGGRDYALGKIFPNYQSASSFVRVYDSKTYREKFPDLFSHSKHVGEIADKYSCSKVVLGLEFPQGQPLTIKIGGGTLSIERVVFDPINKFPQAYLDELLRLHGITDQTWIGNNDNNILVRNLRYRVPHLNAA